MKKTKVFLGGYVTSVNAQNLNCRALAKHLDKENFDVYTLETFSGKLNHSGLEEVHIFRCFKPHRLSRYIGYLWGLFHCDVAYLPKRDATGWNRFLLKLFGKKSFTTVEGIYDDKRIEEITKDLGITREEFFGFYGMFDRVYSITKFLRDYNFKHQGIKSEEEILYLGTDIETFLDENKTIESLQNIILIGNDLIRKGIYDYLELAEKFPSINFHVVGSGNGKIDMNEILKNRKTGNIVYHGAKSHEELKELLKQIDLHILPSRSEGFPKVTLETAAAGVPSLLYSDYGADEWIRHDVEGFVVDTLEEMAQVIRNLMHDPDQLKAVAQNAVIMAKRFDWNVVINDWEKVILELAGKKPHA